MSLLWDSHPVRSWVQKYPRISRNEPKFQRGESPSCLLLPSCSALQNSGVLITHFLPKHPSASQFGFIWIFLSQIQACPEFGMRECVMGMRTLLVQGSARGGREVLPTIFWFFRMCWCWTIPKIPCEINAWISFIWGEPAACPATSTLQSSQLSKILGVPLKFQGNVSSDGGKGISLGFSIALKQP